ncbi:MAG: metal-dependent hydrolase [Deltaproteobacteria bacterium]|nr:metal-dependent hydrolase [Deltaproteobacteria bacterium]
MTELEYLLTTLAAVLIVAVMRHWRPLAGWLDRPGFLLAMTGACIGLLDPALGFMLAPDRIAMLARPPVFAGGLAGLMLIAAVALLAGFTVGGRRALKAAGLLAGGYALFLILSLFSVAGVPLLEPFSDYQVRIPIFPTGYILLIALLAVGLVSIELWNKKQPRVFPVVAVFIGLYFVLAVVVANIANIKGSGLEGPGLRVNVYPGNIWHTHWILVTTRGDQYELRRYDLFGPGLTPPAVIRRWNDEPMLIRLLSDPVVGYFYWRMFNNPVVNIENTNTQISLMIQEAHSLVPMVPGKTFILESDLRGRNRYYQLQRFD